MAINFEKLKLEGVKFTATAYGAKVPGGWLVVPENVGAMVFLPDANHAWDGNSLP
jgi:hypothetical protein